MTDHRRQAEQTPQRQKRQWPGPEPVHPDRMVMAVWMMAAVSVTALAVTVGIAAVRLLPLAPV